MAKALLIITTTALRDALHLPPETDIQGVWQDWDDRNCGVVQLMVAHPDIPLTAEGVRLPVVSPSWSAPTTTFLGWGLPEKE